MYRIRRHLEIFSNNELKTIHNATLEVLQDAGFIVRHDEALKLLSESGAEVDWNTGKCILAHLREPTC